MPRTPKSQAKTLTAVQCRNAAIAALIAKYPSEFRSLYDAERVRAGLGKVRGAGPALPQPEAPGFLRRFSVDTVGAQPYSLTVDGATAAGTGKACAHVNKTVLNGGIVKCSGCGALRRNGQWVST